MEYNADTSHTDTGYHWQVQAETVTKRVWRLSNNYPLIKYIAYIFTSVLFIKTRNRLRYLSGDFQLKFIPGLYNHLIADAPHINNFYPCIFR